MSTRDYSSCPSCGNCCRDIWHYEIQFDPDLDDEDPCGCIPSKENLRRAAG
jgi:hypothetical protein